MAAIGIPKKYQERGLFRIKVSGAVLFRCLPDKYTRVFDVEQDYFAPEIISEFVIRASTSELQRAVDRLT